jgi:hypothetical protein
MIEYNPERQLSDTIFIRNHRRSLSLNLNMPMLEKPITVCLSLYHTTIPTHNSRRVTVLLQKKNSLAYYGIIRLLYNMIDEESCDVPLSSSPGQKFEKAASEQDVSHASASSTCHQVTDEFIPRPPTEDEIKDLPRVMVKIPMTTWLLVFTGSAAAFARYGVSTTFRTYYRPDISYYLI